MRHFVRALVLLVAVSILLSCAGRRARMQQLPPPALPQGSSCTAPAAGACPVCTIQCPVGQAALCAPGKMADGACTVQPSCRCGPPS